MRKFISVRIGFGLPFCLCETEADTLADSDGDLETERSGLHCLEDRMHKRWLFLFGGITAIGSTECRNLRWNWVCCSTAVWVRFE